MREDLQARVSVYNTGQYLEIPKSRSTWADIVIGIPFCHRPVSKQWANAMANLKHPPHARVEIVASQNTEYDLDSIAQTLNSLAQRACQMGAKYLFFVDDDVEIPPYAIQMLLAALKVHPSAKVCGGIYSKKDSPPNNEPLVWDENHTTIFTWPAGAVFRCGGLAAGCMLIDTSVFVQLPLPWFSLRGGMEDAYFCNVVRQEGFVVLAHGQVLCRHWIAEKRIAVETKLLDGEWGGNKSAPC